MRRSLIAPAAPVVGQRRGGLVRIPAPGEHVPGQPAAARFPRRDVEGQQSPFEHRNEVDRDVRAAGHESFHGLAKIGAGHRKLDQSAEGAVAFERPDGGERRFLRTKDVAPNPQYVVQRHCVDPLHDVVDSQDLVSQQFLRAEPAGDGARVFHPQLDAAPRHRFALLELRHRESGPAASLSLPASLRP